MSSLDTLKCFQTFSDSIVRCHFQKRFSAAGRLSFAAWCTNYRWKGHVFHKELDWTKKPLSLSLCFDCIGTISSMSCLSVRFIFVFRVHLCPQIFAFICTLFLTLTVQNSSAATRCNEQVGFKNPEQNHNFKFKFDFPIPASVRNKWTLLQLILFY